MLEAQDSDMPPEIAEKQKNSVWTYLTTEISLEHADVPIIATSFVSGLCDSSSFNAWSAFVCMQTGNTVFLALGASFQPITAPYQWLKCLTSIIFFLFGCFFFAQTRRIDAKHRGTLTGSFLFQAVCIFISAALVQAGVVPQPRGVIADDNTRMRWIELLPLGFLAFQAGGQIVTSRLLGYNEVPTTVLTSVYCDLASDPNFFAGLGKNVKRNRRIASVIALLIGGICGGWLSRSSGGMASALWFAGAVKASIAISWSLWKGKCPGQVQI